MCDIFGKTGGRIGIVLEDNPAGHCFVLNNLIPMKIFKWVMIAKLKMCPVSKIVDKICLIATNWNVKNNFMARYRLNCTFLEGAFFEQHEEFEISLSLWVQFSEPVAKIYFCQIYTHVIP